MVVACSGVLAARATESDLEPEKAFRRALIGKMEPGERVRLLESIPKEHPASKWADDALWVLGEAARQEGSVVKTLHYWQHMMTGWPRVRLEDYTQTTEIYRTSNLPQVESLLVWEGRAYERGEASLVGAGPARSYMVNNATRFNPVPMTVWAELAECYEEFDRPRLAFRAYRKALQAAPPQGLLAQTYLSRMEDMQEELTSSGPARVTGQPEAGVQATDAPAGTGPGQADVAAGDRADAP